MEPFFYAGPLRAAREKEKELFSDVELSFPESSLVIISGESGCGKSTLLKQVVGLVKGWGIRRILRGRCFEEEELPYWRSRVVLMMQDAPVMSGTVRMNLEFPYSLENASNRSFNPARARELMELAGLSHVYMDSDVTHLSGGERHRLALVRVLLWDPDVILADEPLSGLDAANAEVCMRMLSEFARTQGRAVVSVMHENIYVKEADLHLRILNGRLIHE